MIHIATSLDLRPPPHPPPEDRVSFVVSSAAIVDVVFVDCYHAWLPTASGKHSIAYQEMEPVAFYLAVVAAAAAAELADDILHLVEQPELGAT